MKLNIHSVSGKKDSINLNADVFNTDYNEALVHEVISSYRTNGRSGNSAQLSRAEVKGGGAKPWRQKGTGRARAGTSSSPIWRSGGVTFASSKIDYSKKINRKVYKKSLQVIFSQLVRSDRLVIVDEIKVNAPKTKELINTMNALELTNVLFITENFDSEVALAARNLVNVDVVTLNQINPVNLLKFKKVCITVKAIQLLEERLS
ncbi:MAG: 50S ribosomal protein L4 [Legionellales bacterium]|nr:50S ribosomal protein L4 [Legionellales bacterium]